MQDKIVLQKTSHTTHILTVYQWGKMVYKKQLSTKDFLKHDLVHTAIHFLIHEDIFNPQEETMDMEFLAWVLHKVYDTDFDVHESYERVVEYAKQVEQPLPNYFSIDFIKEVRNFAVRYFNQFKLLKPGKSMDILLSK